MKCEDCENYKPNKLAKLTQAKQRRREVLFKIADSVVELKGMTTCLFSLPPDRSMWINEINTRPGTLNYRDDDNYYFFAVPPGQEDEK